MDVLRKRAIKMGASEFGTSRVNGKKYYVMYNGKRINFGALGMSDYTKHKDIHRRNRYRARHKAIMLKDGRAAYRVKSQPAYWSYYLLW
jgi:hypothetical protein